MQTFRVSRTVVRRAVSTVFSRQNRVKDHQSYASAYNYAQLRIYGRWCQYRTLSRVASNSLGNKPSISSGDHEIDQSQNEECDKQVNGTELELRNQSYFKALADEASKVSNTPISERIPPAVDAVPFSKISTDALSGEEVEIYSKLKPTSLKPSLKETSVSLAAYVNDSPTLTKLMQLGVDLSKVEHQVNVANKLLTLDFDKDAKPYLLFLHDVGVPDNELGKWLTKNPRLFFEHLDDLHVRTNYLRSKKFTQKAVAKIVTKAPKFLSQTTKETDAQLGYLQREFKLKGDEVRAIVTRLPKLTTWPRAHIKDVKFHLKEQMGFKEEELKQMALATPKLLVAGKQALLKRFDVIHNVVGFSHEKIAQWPSVLRTRTHILKQRHAFLSELGRAQYDVTKENYVSVKALVSGRDEEFSQNVAKVPVKRFNDFLKTL